jgi:NADH-quinone oxidoreductase subunit L/multicomponent Na+:H+ antiporter subunit D
MTEIDSLRPLAAVLVSAVAIAPILASYRRPNLREGWTMLAALTTFGLVASMVPGVLAGDTYVTDFGTFVPGVESNVAFALRVDPLGLLFALLASTLWVITSLYSIGYMRGLNENDQTRYFAAFAGSVSAAVGVALADNLVVLFVFYELLTVATYPLVAHDQTDEARRAGRKYLAYTFGGGVAVLAGTLLVVWLTGTADFSAGGIAALAEADPALARVAFALLVGGFGVKAALMPLHSWLPDAMVAPTPVSGLLHAVAVVKSGVFGIARVVLDVFGPETVGDLGMGLPLAAVAAFTLIAASIIALRQDNLKRRLAFSTVSQLSYIVLGLAVLHPRALTGGLLHIPAHAFMKLTLFFCAGAIHVETHTDDISEMAGIGKRMPATMVAFAIASLGMAGIPLVAGFVSKWYLLIGSVEAGQVVFAAALLLSGVLNIAYFWPIVYQAFFESEDALGSKPLIENPFGGRSTAVPDGGCESSDSQPRPPPAARGPAAHDCGKNAGRSSPPPPHPDEGKYAVDRNPSDHVRPEHQDHVANGHQHGPPAGGWERRTPSTETTWFMLGPILAAATGAIVLGIVPGRAVFLELVNLVVAGATGVSL